MVFRRIPTTWAWEPGQAPKRKEAGGVGKGLMEVPGPGRLLLGVHTEATRADLTPFSLEHLMGPHLGGTVTPQRV